MSHGGLVSLLVFFTFVVVGILFLLQLLGFRISESWHPKSSYIIILINSHALSWHRQKQHVDFCNYPTVPWNAHLENWQFCWLKPPKRVIFSASGWFWAPLLIRTWRKPKRSSGASESNNPKAGVPHTAWLKYAFVAFDAFVCTSDPGRFDAGLFGAGLSKRRSSASTFRFVDKVNVWQRLKKMTCSSCISVNHCQSKSINNDMNCIALSLKKQRPQQPTASILEAV